MRNLVGVALLLAGLLLPELPAIAGVSAPPYVPPAVAVTLRAPGAADDLTTGRAVDDLWRALGTTWKATSVASGAAVWRVYYAAGQAPLPGDAISATPVAAVGTHKLYKAYAGNWLVLTRSSDAATLTLGFVGGTGDFASGDTFCDAGGIPNANGCWVSTLYDQVPSSGKSFLQPTKANGIPWTRNTVAGRRSLLFNALGRTINSGTYPTTAVWMAMSPAPSLVPMNVSVVFAGQAHSTQETGCAASVGPSNDANYYFANDGVDANRTPGMVVRASSPGVLAPVTAGFFGWWQTGGTAVTQANNLKSGSLTSGAGVSAQSGLAIGCASTGMTSGNADSDLLDMMVFNTAVGASDRLVLQATLSDLDGIFPQLRDPLIVLGDSTSSNPRSALRQSYPQQLIADLAQPMAVYNLSLFGTTLASQMARTSTISALCGSNARNRIITYKLGDNDIRAGASAATIQANHQTYVASLRSVCPDARIVNQTSLAASDLTSGGANDTVRLAVNAWMLTNRPGDAVADIGGDPALGSYSAMQAATAWSVDGQHMTDQGNAIYRATLTGPINGLVQ